MKNFRDVQLRVTRYHLNESIYFLEMEISIIFCNNLVGYLCMTVLANSSISKPERFVALNAEYFLDT
jgi:hypothetical protein